MNSAHSSMDVTSPRQGSGARHRSLSRPRRSGGQRGESSRHNNKVETMREPLAPLRVSGPDEFCVHILKGHNGFVLSLSIVGDVLFTGSQDHQIMIWDLNNLQYIGTLPGHKGFVRCLEASYTRRLLFSGSSDRSIKAWSLETFTTVKTLTGHTGEVFSLKILQHTLVSGSEDRTIRVWDIATFEQLLIIENAHSSSIFFTPSSGR